MSFKTQFPLGSQVRLRADAEHSYLAEIRRRVEGGRIGVISGHTFPSERPIVVFPKSGRRQEFRFGVIVPADWEVVQ